MQFPTNDKHTMPRRTTPIAVYKLRDRTTRAVDVSGRYGMNRHYSQQTRGASLQRRAWCDSTTGAMFDE